MKKSIVSALASTAILASGLAFAAGHADPKMTTAGELTFDVIPAPGEVRELSTFDIQYELDDEIVINEEATERPYLYIDSEAMRYSKWSNISAMGNTLSLTAQAAITEPDTYTLVIPTGFILAGGQPVPGISVKYEIKGGEETECPAIFSPAAGAVSALPAVIDIIFPDNNEAGLGGGKATISRDGGESVSLPDAEFGEAYNEMLQPLTGEFQGLDEVGTYVITFPKGYFVIDGNDAPAMTLTYVIGDAPVPTGVADFTPADLSTLTALPEQVDFIFPAYEDGWTLGNGVATISYDGEEPVALPDATYDMEDWNYPLNQGWLPLGDFAGRADEGTYVITFPAGYFHLGYNETPSPEMILTYYVAADTQGKQLESVEVTFTPAPGEISGLPNQIDFIFPDYEEAGFWPNFDGPAATIKFNDEAPVELPICDFNWDGGFNEGVQPLGEFAGKTEAGTYTITFPQTYFLLGEEPYDLSPEIVIVYTIKGETPVPDPITVDPADGSELNSLPAFITLTFPSEWIEGESLIDPTLQFNDNEPVDLPEFEKDYDLDYLLYQQSLGAFAGATEEGTYVIRFPEDFFRIGSWAHYAESVPVPAMEITYHIGDFTGVTLVGIEADRYFVYDLNGVKVLETSNADDLKTLKGLYIVNGVKMVLK